MTPLALARLHQRLAVGDRISLETEPSDLRNRLVGAGFGAARRRGSGWTARREFTLPDYVKQRLQLLVCGLNPSLPAAETGVPYCGPGNRFWPAALSAGIVSADRDPFAALRNGVGFTDLVKRATRGADELDAAEYAHGLERVHALIVDTRPERVCFVGLDGWRRAVDRKATPGWVREPFAGRPLYLMPSTSGRNAHTTPDALAAHLEEAYRGTRCPVSGPTS